MSDYMSYIDFRAINLADRANEIGDFSKISPKVNDQPIQNDTQEKPTKNKWLHPKDNFGKLKRGTD